MASGHNEQFDVFMSYSHRDSEFVVALDVALRAAGLKVFLDDRDIRAGDRLVERVFDGIAAAQAQVVVLSEASAASSWVKDELSAARLRSIETGSRVVPILIEDSEIPNALAHLKYVDLRDWLSDRSFRHGISELLHALGEKYQPLADDALAWALTHTVELYQLDREFTYAIGHLDGGIAEMTGVQQRAWTSYKHTLNDILLAKFLLADESVSWPRGIVEEASLGYEMRFGCFVGGLALIQHWLAATGAPADDAKTRILHESVGGVLDFLTEVEIVPWRRVLGRSAAAAGEIRDGVELRNEVRRTSEAFHQLMGDVVRVTPQPSSSLREHGARLGPWQAARKALRRAR
jgi:hypothetical protein